MIVFRLCRARYAFDLSGKGAEASGGRWNSKGVPMLYTSESRALCTAEIAVHLPLGIVPADYQMVSLYFPDDDMLELPKQQWPEGWNAFPYPASTRMLGDNFVREGKFLSMKAPSAVVEGDFNYLINPRHPAFGKVRVRDAVPFNLDTRLLKK